MTRDELEAILAVKEREMGEIGRRGFHFHECRNLDCRIVEPCEDKTCMEPPSGKRLPCSQRDLTPCQSCGDRRVIGVVHLCVTAFAEAERRLLRGELP